VRLFAAIEIDPAICERLVRVQKELRGFDRAIRWLTPDQMHLTIKFLGEVPDGDVPVVCDALKSIAEETPAFDLEVHGLGCFPERGGVRIVWAGLREPTGALVECREHCETLFAELGFKQEHRGFAPHLTIGRVKEARSSEEIRLAVERHADYAGGAQGVDEIVLFESVLKREGAQYAPVCRCELAEEA
jgi:2'-5' RNA ligase